MDDLDSQIKQALRNTEELSEDKLEQIRKDSRAMFEKEKSNNNKWSLSLMIVGFLLIGLWGWLFYQAESTKMQILWAVFLVGEGLGIAIGCAIHFLIHNDLVAREEMREIEFQLAELKEQLKGKEA